jgi:hypothetical protein
MKTGAAKFLILALLYAVAVLLIAGCSKKDDSIAKAEKKQVDKPGVNWLPAPNGPIYLVMRLYWPRQETPSILPPGEGSWKPPAIVASK